MALTINFVEVLGSGKLALSERPKLKEVKKLVPAGCDRVVTILAERGEQAHRIGAAVEACGISWEWLKITHARNFTAEERKNFKLMVTKIYLCLLENESVLIHCSAGLHRTGMFAYALLRKGGLRHEDALKAVSDIRLETFEALEGKYIDLADELY